MQSRSGQSTQGVRRRTRTRTHSLHTHLTDLLGVVLALLFVCMGAPYVHAGNTPAKPDIDAIRNGDVQVTRSNGKLQIQASDGSIIDYSNFDIPQNYEVQFNQGSASARVLNRDQSGQQSIINGALNADGQVYLANPAGFAIGASASINVGRFVAAAGHISDESFLNGQDKFTNLDGTVINEGEITAGGVSLLGERVENYGRISAPHGMITMSAGETVYLGKATGHTFVEIQKTGNGSKDGAAITNEGTIKANGGSAKLAAGDVYSTAVEQNGLVDVSGASGGDLQISGGSLVDVEGTLDATGTQSGGGDIDIDADDVLVTSGGQIDASGLSGGGTIDVDAGRMNSNGDLVATGQEGPGGTIDVSVDGSFSATSSEVMDASGTKGGQIRLWAGDGVMTSGTYRAIGTDGDGGRIEQSAGTSLTMLSPDLDASGTEGGGDILLGGHLTLGETHDPLAAAQKTAITDGTTLDAFAEGENGTGGSVHIWSEEATDYYGEIDVRPGTEQGAGGFVELSSAGALSRLDTDSIYTGRGERSGSILIDPENITITSNPPSLLDVLAAGRFGVADSTLNDGDGINAQFGSGVALTDAGDLLFVGASGFDSNNGAVFAFDTENPENPQLLLQMDQSNAGFTTDGQSGFGLGVSGDGSRLAVGARSANSNAGEVLLYETSNLNLDNTDPVNASPVTIDGSTYNDGTGNEFGWAVSLDGPGHLLAVGDGNNEDGVFLFDVTDLGNISPEALVAREPFGVNDGAFPVTTFIGTSNAELDFGVSVALDSDGDNLAVGDSDGGTKNVWLFDDSGRADGLPVTDNQTFFDNDPNGDGRFLFGQGVDFSGDGNRLAVGGNSIVYLYDTSNISDGSQIGSRDRGNYGDSVSLDGDGDLVAVGGVGSNPNGDGEAELLIAPSTISDPANATFSNDARLDAFFTPSEIVSALDGSSLTLQANNDITVNSAVDATGLSGGNLTLEAGRDINVNADLVLDGTFTATANAGAAQAANRDSGEADFLMADGTKIDTSVANGNITITLADGPSGSESTSTINVATLNAGAGDITLDAVGDGGTNTVNMGTFTTTGASTLEGSGSNDAVILTGEAGTGSLTYNAGAGDDTLTLDFASGNVIPAGGVTFNGEGQSTPGGDTLTLENGSGGLTTHTYNFTGSDGDGNNGSLELDNGTIFNVALDGVGAITNNLLGDDVSFNLGSAGNDATLQNDTDGDVELLSNNLDVAFANPGTSLTIDAQGGTDTVDVKPLDTDFSAGLNLEAAENIVFTLTSGKDDVQLQDDSDGQSELVDNGGTYQNVTFENPANKLTVNGSGGSDVIRMSPMDSGFSPTNGVRLNGAAEIFLTLSTGADDVQLQDNGNATDGLSRLNDRGGTFEAVTFENPATEVQVNGQGGDDIIDVTTLDDDFDAIVDLNGEGDGSGDSSTVAGAVDVDQLKINAESIDIDNPVTTTGKQIYTGFTTIAAKLQTDGGPVTVNGSTVVSGDRVIDTDDGDDGTAGAVTFQSSGHIDAANGNDDTLTIDAAGTTDGAVTVSGDVGGENNGTGIIGGFTINDASTVDVQSITVDSGTENVGIDIGAISAVSGIDLNGGSMLDTSGAGGGTATNDITLNASGDVDVLGGDATLNTNDQGFDGGSNTNGTTDGAISISGTQIDGQSSSYGLAMDIGENNLGDGDIPELTNLSSFAVISGGSVTSEDTTNTVGTLAIDAVDNISYTDDTGYTVGTVQGVSGVISSGGDVTLEAGGALEGASDDATDDIEGATITLTASSGGIGTSTVLDVNASTALSADTSADGGGIFLDSPNVDLPVDVIDARTGSTSGDVVLDAGSNAVFAEQEDGDIEVDATNFGVRAGAGIGDNDGNRGGDEVLDTTVDVLNADNNTSNNIEVNNSGGMTLNTNPLGSSEAVSNGGGDVVLTDDGMINVMAGITSSGAQQFNADVKTADGLTFDAGAGITVTGRLEIGDAGTDDQPGDLTVDGDVLLADSAVFEVTLNGTSASDHDQLIVSSGNTLQIGNDPTDASTGPVLDGTINNQFFPLGSAFTVIDNQSTSASDSTGFFENALVQFGPPQQDFQIHRDDAFTTDNNDVVLERILERFIWTGEGSDALWSTSGNWQDGSVPSARKGIIFDTTRTGNELDVDLDVDAEVEQVRFADRGTGNESNNSYVLNDAGGSLTLINEQLVLGIENQTTATQTIDAPVVTDDASTSLATHRIQTADRLELTGPVDGPLPLQLVNSNGGSLVVTNASVDVQLDTGAGNTLDTVDVSTSGNVDVLSDLTVSGPVTVPEGTVRTPAGSTPTITTPDLTIGDRLEVGDQSGSEAVGTLVVDGDLELTGDAVYETTLASSDVVDVNGGVTLTDSPSVEIVTNTQFDETASFTVLDNNGTSDAISGSVAETTLTTNSQEFLVNLNAGDGNDLVINRQDTERVDPTSGSTDRGGQDEVKSTTHVNVTGEDGLDETVTDDLSEDEMEALVTVLDEELSGEETPEPTPETGREFLHGELGGALGSRMYNQQLVARYSSRADDLEAQLRLLEETTNEATRDEETSERMEQLRETIDILRARADRVQQRLDEDEDGEEDETSVAVDEDIGLDQIPSEAQTPQEDDASVSAVGQHTLVPDRNLEEITPDQLRDQLRNDLQLQMGVFTDEVSQPVLAAIWTSLEQNTQVQAPNLQALREIAGTSAARARQLGNGDLALQLQELQEGVKGWNPDDVMQFRTTVGGDTGWGSSTVEVFLNRATGEYLMTADVMINENAANRSKGTTFGAYAGDTLQGYEGGFHTLTLTGTVEE